MVKLWCKERTAEEDEADNISKMYVDGWQSQEQLSIRAKVPEYF